MSGARTIVWCNFRQNGNGTTGTIAVPAPVDPETPDVQWWYDRIALMAPRLAAMGVTDILFPNPVIGAGAPGPGDDGYNPYDDYDIGQKSVPTRFGTDEQMRRAAAVVHANGMNVLLDIVLHQRMGGKDGVYNYKSATGKTNGRFPKWPSCFRMNPSYVGGVPEDPVPVPSDDFEFGDELCPVNAIPKHYVWNGLIEAGNWLFRTTGADGARLDDMKGMAVEFINAYMNTAAMATKWFFGEYDDGNPDDEAWWIGQVDQRSSAVDFAFQENMAYPMCMQAGKNTGWEMSWMTNGGLVSINPMKAVPFVSSMDSETDGWATIVNNKTLGMALLAGFTGTALFYIKDFLDEPQGYGLANPMTNLIWCRAMLASGDVDVVYADAKTFVFRRTGSSPALIALNNDVWNPDWTTVTCRSGFPPGYMLKDYTGKNTEKCLVDDARNVTFGIPPAANGNGYGFWAPDGYEGEIRITPRSTTQTIFGAGDLVPGPVKDGTQSIARFDVAKGATVTAKLTADQTDWTIGTRIDFQIDGPDGEPIGGGLLEKTGSFDAHNLASLTGWHTVVLTGIELPPDGSSYEFEITYTAPTIPTMETT